ncbi:hypothetical protein BC826DRAFT_1105197 [Russula brevipes]|nr:hypothetical protein BC826DRAFT_1105197 [Russula brevipes]
MSESGIVQEPIELETRVGPSQSVSYSPSSSSAPSVQDSPPHSVSLLPTGSAHNSSSSLRAGSPVSFRELTIHRSSTPVSWTHPRAAATQFTGSSLHSRSRSPSPSRSLFHRRRAGHDTPERLDIDTSRPPVTVQDSSGSPETSTHSSSGIPVHVQPPSRAGTLDTGSPPQSPLSSISIHVRTQDLPAIPQVPSIEALNSSAVSLSPKWPGPLVYGTPGSARHRSGSIQSGSPTPQSGQGSQHSVTFPEPFASSISIQIPTNASGTQLGQHPITAPFPQSSTSPISIQTSVTNASGIQTAPPSQRHFCSPPSPMGALMETNALRTSVALREER